MQVGDSRQRFIILERAGNHFTLYCKSMGGKVYIDFCSIIRGKKAKRQKGKRAKGQKSKRAKGQKGKRAKANLELKPSWKIRKSTII